MQRKSKEHFLFHSGSQYTPNHASSRHKFCDILAVCIFVFSALGLQSTQMTSLCTAAPRLGRFPDQVHLMWCCLHLSLNSVALLGPLHEQYCFDGVAQLVGMEWNPGFCRYFPRSYFLWDLGILASLDRFYPRFFFLWDPRISAQVSQPIG